MMEQTEKDGLDPLNGWYGCIGFTSTFVQFGAQKIGDLILKLKYESITKRRCYLVALKTVYDPDMVFNKVEYYY